MSEIIRIVFSPTLCGGHSGNRAPVNTETGEKRFNTKKTKKTKTKKQHERGDEKINAEEKRFHIVYHLQRPICHERGLSEATARRDWKTGNLICQHRSFDQLGCEMQAWHF